MCNTTDKTSSIQGFINSNGHWKFNVSQRHAGHIYQNSQNTAGSNWVEEKLEGTLSKVWGIETLIFRGCKKQKSKIIYRQPFLSNLFQQVSTPILSKAYPQVFLQLNSNLLCLVYRSWRSITWNHLVFDRLDGFANYRATWWWKNFFLLDDSLSSSLGSL